MVVFDITIKQTIKSTKNTNKTIIHTRPQHVSNQTSKQEQKRKGEWA